jgi:hypothetical protein
MILSCNYGGNSESLYNNGEAMSIIKSNNNYIMEIFKWKKVMILHDINWSTCVQIGFTHSWKTHLGGFFKCFELLSFFEFLISSVRSIMRRVATNHWSPFTNSFPPFSAFNRIDFMHRLTGMQRYRGDDMSNVGYERTFSVTALFASLPRS